MYKYHKPQLMSRPVSLHSNHNQPLFQTKMAKSNTLFQTKMVKTIHFGTIHTYIDHTG